MPRRGRIVSRLSSQPLSVAGIARALEALVVGAACVARSWGLGPRDVNLNMMPLFHVGGIVRNLARRPLRFYRARPVIDVS